MDWHDSTCRRLDLAKFGDGMCCMRCGSVRPAHPILPAIRQLSEIRLLRLSPGAFDDDIDCEITTVDLSSRLDYEAISYTWADETGDASHSQTIWISQKPFQVTKNCEMALKRVRMLYSPRNIWIDAICINQDDILERGHQVGIMPEIYSRAKGVLIYVGEHPSFKVPVSSMDRGSYDDEALLEAISWPMLLSKQYFKRLWILQEVALARRATLMWGDLSFPWSSILEKRDSLDPNTLPPVLHDFDYRAPSSPEQIFNLLLVTRSCNASDPRDKIYALLGLLPSRCIGKIEADYSIEAQELFTQVAIYFAKNIDWSQILFQAGTAAQKDGLVSTLPSWVPDWSAPLSQKFRSDTVYWRMRSGSLPAPNLPPMHVEYNEAEQTIKMKLIHRPSWQDEWNIFEGDWNRMSMLAVDFLWFPESSKHLYEQVSHMRDKFHKKHNSQIMVDEVDLHMKLNNLIIRMEKIGASRYSLTALPEQHEHSVTYRGIHMDSAVQCLTVSWVRQDLRALLEMIRLPVGIRSSYSSDDSKNLLALVPMIENSANELEPLHDQELEQLWMKKFMAGELLELESSTYFRDEQSAIAPDHIQELMKRLNDGSWRFLVRSLCLRPEIIEIV